ncbi:hypothetical protein BaRGS_00004063, partial [Batillaria attramentaria]
MTERIDIDILEGKNPSCFTARASTKEEKRIFLNARKRWNDDLESREDSTVINYQPHVFGVYLLCLISTSSMRCALSNVETKGGAGCFFVDTGKKQHVPLYRLRQLPEEFLCVPCQVRILKLWGVRPLTRTLELTDTGFQIPQRASKKWDDSAISFFQDLVAKSHGAQADVMHKNVEGTMYVRLHLHLPDGWLCVNDKLVADQYAIQKSYPDSGTDSDSSCSSSQHIVEPTSTRTSLKQRLSPGSDPAPSSEIILQNKDDLHKCFEASFDDPMMANTETLSEAELNHVLTKINRISSYPRGYQSDTGAKKVAGEKFLGVKSNLAQQSGRGRVVGSLSSGGDPHRLMLYRDIANFKTGQAASGSDASSLEAAAVASGQGNLLQAKVSVPKSRGDDVADPKSARLNQHKPKNSSQPASLTEVSVPALEPLRGMPALEPLSRNAASGPLSPMPELEQFSDAETCETSSVTNPSHSPGSAGKKASPLTHVSDVSSPSGITQPVVPRTGGSASPLSHASGVSSLGVARDSPVMPKGRGRGLRPLLSSEILSVQHPPAAVSPVTGIGRPGGSSVICEAEPVVNHEKLSPSGGTSTCTMVSVHQSSAKNLENKPFDARPKFTGARQPSVTVGDKTSSSDLAPGSVTLSVKSETPDQDVSSLKEERGPRNKDTPRVLLSGNERPGQGRGKTLDDIGIGSQKPLGRRRDVNGFRSQDSHHSSSEEDESFLVTKSQLIGKQEGRKLLDSMGGGKNDADCQLQLPQVCRGDRTMPTPFLGTRVWGTLLPDPAYTLRDVAFVDFIKESMKQEIKTPYAIQAHSWPSILRGRHVVGIAPPRGGKTLAYLPALLTQLTECNYLSLPKGSGPKALILIPSWRKAHEIGEYVNGIMRRHTTLRTILPLLEGCDLLIATPHCLLRMIDKGYTNLKRLCHLILDDAEVLVEEFTPQIRQIMSEYASCLEQSRQLPVPRQILLFSTAWTPGVASFQSQYQLDPVLVFASRLEASVFGKVQQVVHLCMMPTPAQQLVELLNGLTTGPDHRRIIITTETDERARDIEQLLETQSIYCVVVDSTMGTFGDDVEEQVNRWRTQVTSAVLVVTDAMIYELRLTCAQVVIHYDLPKSKTTFGNRLACMLDYFHDQINGSSSEKPAVQPVSHIMISYLSLDRERLEHIRSLRDFLARSDATIPAGLTALLAGMYEGLNKDDTKSLCKYIKAFGRCIKEFKCPDRHLVLSVDSVKEDGEESWPPGTGEVKIRVCKIISANHFFVRLLEHRVVGQPKRDLRSMYTTLIMEMSQYLSKPANQAPYALEQGSRFLAAVGDKDGVYKRARVITALSTKLQSGSRKVKVQYVDEGPEDTVEMEQLLKLPPHLQEVPPQAVEVYVCRIKPLDGDSDWTLRSNDFVKEQLLGKELMGTVVLRMKGTLWLDPLSEQTMLPTLKMKTVTMIARNELMKRGMASDNPDHIKNLYKLCEGKISIPQNLIQRYLSLPPTQHIDTELLAADEEFHEVCVSFISSPHHFYVQKPSKEAELVAMVEELNQHMNKVVKPKSEGTEEAGSPVLAGKTIPQKTGDGSPKASGTTVSLPAGDVTAHKSAPGGAIPTQTVNGPSPHAVNGAASPSRSGPQQKPEEKMALEAGSVCVAKFLEDDRWYRGRLVEMVECGWKVFFIDYGECEVVAEDNIHRLPDKFCALPAQAIECSLASVRPAGDEWSADSREALLDMTCDIAGEKKIMVAKVQECGEAEYAGWQNYVVDLYDTTLPSRDLYVNQELVWLGLACPEDERLTDLFPETTFSARKLYPSLGEKICAICAAVYWTQNDERSKSLATLAVDSLMAELKIGNGTLFESGALQAVVSLIGYVKSCDTQAILLDAMVQCVKTKPRLCVAAAGEELMLRLVYCIEQARSSSVQIQAAKAAAEMARVDGFREILDREQILNLFCLVLEADPLPEILHPSCSFLTTMLRRGQVCPRALKGTTVCKNALQLLSNTHDVKSQELLLGLLSAAAMHESLQAPLLREAPLAQILEVLQNAASQQCVFHCASICQSMCQASRRNKRLLLEGGLVLILRDLLADGVQSPAKEVCEELNTSLAITAPRQEVLAGAHFTRQHTAKTSQSLIYPLVKWGQNTFRVLLTVQLRGAKETDFTISQNEVHCRCEVDGQMYGFDYTLFGDLERERCRVKAGPSVVRLSLAKQQKGKWSRLLKEKQKLPSLMADYDNLVDSGSDSEIDDDENMTALAR